MTERRRSWGTRALGCGLGLTLPIALLGAAPANAADAPNTIAAARTAKASATQVWLKDSIRTAGDRDYFKFTTTKSERVRLTLGSLPANYALTLLDSAGHTVATSDRAKVGFEQITRTLAAGTWLVRVTSSAGAHSTKQYELKFRRLPAGVFTLSTGTHIYAPGNLGVIAEVYNNTSSWQDVRRLHLTYRNSKGKALATEVAPMLDGLTTIAPHSTMPFSWAAVDVPKAIVSTSVTVDANSFATPSVASIKVKITKTTSVGHERRYEGTVSTSSSHRLADVLVQGQHYSTLGNLTGTDYYVVAHLAKGKPVKFKLAVDSGATPNTRVVTARESIYAP